MSNFYTRKGDDGKTGLLGEGRISKSHLRIETLGTLDEATSTLGLARAACHDPKIIASVMDIQRDLYHLMAEIAATPENALQFKFSAEERVSWLESQVEAFSSNLEIPREFILPGDTSSGAAFSLARTVIRRAERRLAELQEQGEIDNPILLKYINRLSSLCFILELVEDRSTGKSSTLAKGEVKE
jgi:cob(I)alamin adenosyltransferase